MILARVWPADAVLEWHRIGSILAPAIKDRPQLEVLQRIVSREFQCWTVAGEAVGVVVTSVGPTLDTTARCIWIVYAAGKSGGLRNMRRLLAEFERMAADDGCREIRVEEPRWRRVLKDYAFDGRILRKAI